MAGNIQLISELAGQTHAQCAAQGCRSCGRSFTGKGRRCRGRERK